MKSVIPNCTGVRCKFREKLLVVRGGNGMEFSVPYDEIDETSEVQDVRYRHADHQAIFRRNGGPSTTTRTNDSRK
jgi:hypothetical protein